VVGESAVWEQDSHNYEELLYWACEYVVGMLPHFDAVYKVF